MLSPFEPDLGDQHLPEALRQQYLFSVDEPYTIFFEGNADRVWHRPAWLAPFFFILTWFKIFFPETGENVPTQLHIVGGRDSSAQPVHHWDRTFHFARDRYFNAIMAYDRKLNSVTEKMGPFGMLQVFWNIEFCEPDRLKITSSGCCLGIGSFRIFLPRFLYPAVAVEETAIDKDRIYLDLVASHPWLGNIFGYAGTFQLRRADLQE